MDNLYDFYSWSKLHQQEMLREARERRLAEQVRAGQGGRRSGRSRAGLLLGLLRVTGGREGEKGRPPLGPTPATAEDIGDSGGEDLP